MTKFSFFGWTVPLMCLRLNCSKILNAGFVCSVFTLRHCLCEFSNVFFFLFIFTNHLNSYNHSHPIPSLSHHLHLCLSIPTTSPPSLSYGHHFLPSSLQDELQEPFGVPGLAVLPVPAHHRHLCPGAVGKVHLQLHPLLRHRHGDLHLVCLCAHPRAARTGVFLGDLWRPAWEHHGAHELNEGEEEAAAGWINMKSPYHFLLGPQSTSLHHVHPQPQRSVTSSNRDWKHEDLNGTIWKSEPYYLLYVPNPLALPHGIRHSTLHHFHTLAVKRLVNCLSFFSFIDFFFLPTCPVWVHTTSGFCMIGSYVGGSFACSSQYKI